MAVVGVWALFYERGTPVGFRGSGAAVQWFMDERLLMKTRTSGPAVHSWLACFGIEGWRLRVSILGAVV